ncbi:MAG: siderophore-interacting protein [Paracoccus denitrificans]|nr:MAG: siderophore-interacting protein [Paracoccus denitrificans]PZO86280.1 MAG: siderophore-interacting protein [Paracoccus denitrificans]
MLTANARIAISQPPADMLRAFCEHLVEHGAGYEGANGVHALSFPFGTATLTEKSDSVAVAVSGPTLAAIADLRSIIAGHLNEFAPAPLTIRWTGDGAQMKRPPNYRVLEVVSCQDLTPRMRRIRFSGSDLGVFAGLDNIHVRLVFSPAGGLAQPELGPNGLERWPVGDAAPAFRRYTIREIDAAEGHLDIDFVLHAEAAGPGSRFAETADAGKKIGMIGPGGGTLPFDRDWYLIAGDETALPAIQRIMERFPATARGEVILQVESDAERQQMTGPEGVRVSWLMRPDTLADAVAGITPPNDAVSPYVWVGTEDDDFRKLRRFVRDDLHLTKGQHNVVAYWKKGHAED